MTIIRLASSAVQAFRCPYCDNLLFHGVLFGEIKCRRCKIVIKPMKELDKIKEIRVE